MALASQLSVGAVLVGLTLLLQCAGMATLIRSIKAHQAAFTYRLGAFRSGMLMLRFTSLIFVLHLLQILVWAGFYRWNCFASWESAFYFSAVTYSTVGYGDLVLPVTWRNLGPLEGVAGVLMCGLSAALLFAIVIRLVQRVEGLTVGHAPATVEQRIPRTPMRS